MSRSVWYLGFKWYVEDFSNTSYNSLKHYNYARQEQLENGSAQANQNNPSIIPSEEDDIFIGLDDVPGKWILHRMSLLRKSWS